MWITDLCPFLCPLVTVQRYAMEGFESPEMQLMAPERQPRPRCRPDPQSFIHTEPVFSSGSTTSAPELESKAERIARYKAERRRQLAERYGIPLDQEPDVECPPRYTHSRKELEGSERRNRSESVGEEDKDITLSSYTSTSAVSPRVGRTAPQQGHPDRAYEMGRSRLDSFSERERLMNLENQRRAAHPEPPSSSYMDVTSMSSAAWVPDKDYSVTGMPPSSPKLSRDSSVSSPKQGVSPGDHFIEQQAYNILSRQGWVVLIPVPVWSLFIHQSSLFFSFFEISLADHPLSSAQTPASLQIHTHKVQAWFPCGQNSAVSFSFIGELAVTALSIRLTLPPYNYVIYEFEVKLCPSYPQIPKATFTSQAVAILLGRSIIKVNVFLVTTKDLAMFLSCWSCFIWTRPKSQCILTLKQGTHRPKYCWKKIQLTFLKSELKKTQLTAGVYFPQCCLLGLLVILSATESK